jgi:hypothetical protein
VAALSHEAWRARWLPELDPGIAPYVDALRGEGIETFESCDGGDGHAYTEPTVRFSGGRDEPLARLLIEGRARGARTVCRTGAGALLNPAVFLPSDHHG